MPYARPTTTTLRLEARDPSRNIARRYSINISRDLFGELVVELEWGRIGSAGQRRSYAFPNSEDAERFFNRVIANRARAPRRIGVSYRAVQEF